MIREHITDRAHGIDISHWQEQFIYARTWGQIDFAIAKIGEGYNVPWNSKGNGTFDEFNRLWIGGCAEVPIRGVYHYLRSGYSWELQATKVLNAANKLEVKPHILALDVERISNTFDSAFVADVRRVIQFWNANAPQYKAVLYSNLDVLKYSLFPLGLKYFGAEYTKFLLEVPLWYAQYWLLPSPNKQPGMPSQRSTWNIWQYTSNGDSYKYIDGIRWRHYGSPDLNVFNGSVEDMRKWLGLDVVPPPPPAGRVVSIVDETGQEWVKA